MNHPRYQQIAHAIRRREIWTDGEPLRFPEEGADLFFLSVNSRHGRHLLGHPSYRCEAHGLEFGPEPTEDAPTDAEVEENLRFRYPLLRDAAPASSRARCKHLVVLFHGLNERSFTKYVPWAYHLWRSTGAAVALYPIAFHIRRVSPVWGTQLQAHLAARQALPGNENAHAFNAVISARLGLHPERFFWGGLQTYGEVIDLVREIRAGAHPHVDPAAQIDLVGYSAGGYLTLGLLLLDEGGLFSRTRAVVFESGAALRDVNLSSRLIVDLAAETALMKLFVRHTRSYANPRLRHWLEEHEEGRWFRALCGEASLRRALEARLAALAPRLVGVTNLNDQVIPAGGVMNLLQGLHRDTGVRVEEMELGVHEHPFACTDYGERDRRFITDFIDVERYGPPFERFIHTASALLGP
jgi:hypothetical protein